MVRKQKLETMSRLETQLISKIDENKSLKSPKVEIKIVPKVEKKVISKSQTKTSTVESNIMPVAVSNTSKVTPKETFKPFESIIRPAKDDKKEPIYGFIPKKNVSANIQSTNSFQQKPIQHNVQDSTAQSAVSTAAHNTKQNVDSVNVVDGYVPVKEIIRYVKPELTKAVGNYIFFVQDGTSISDLKELAMILDTMADGVFMYHVNESKNDFANWTRDVMGETELAEELSKITEKNKTQQVVLKYLVKKHL